MANISSANGTIKLKGRWTKKAVELFLPILKSWRFYGEYGIQWCETPSYQNRTVSFSGYGRWSFSGSLEDFDSWTRSFLKDKAGQDTTEDAYDEFLRLMEEKNLKIEFDFEDKDGGIGLRNHDAGYFTSEGGKLVYHKTKCEAILFDDSGLDYAVAFFSHFLTDPDEEAVRVWIEDNVCFTDVFRQWGMEDYDQIIYEMDEFGEDPFHSFCMEFSPDTDKWEEFCEMYEEIKEYRPECE